MGAKYRNLDSLSAFGNRIYDPELDRCEVNTPIRSMRSVSGVEIGGRDLE